MEKIIKTLLLIMLFILTFILESPAMPIPDTGQTKCYNDTSGEILCPQAGEEFFGQDANYNINPPSYTKLDANANDLFDTADKWFMVRDNVTGLIWEVKTDDETIYDKSETYLLENIQDLFINQLNNSIFGNNNNWRLPEVKELASIVNRDIINPSINIAYFPNTESGYYWASEQFQNFAGDGWDISFENGVIGYNAFTSENHVRAVSGNKDSVTDHQFINPDGTVTDIKTGLMWQQMGTTAPMNWKDALAQCENMNLAGYTDWRLPSINELLSISDFNLWNPALNKSVFPDTQPGFYWSSTSYAGNNSLQAWCWESWGGGSNYQDPGKDDLKKADSSLFVRAVRGGQNQLADNLIISNPAQASAWSIGSKIPITWKTRNIAGNVKISLSRKGGKTGTFETIVDAVSNSGNFEWIVTGPPSVNCVLKIEPVSQPDRGTTQGLFMIGDIRVSLSVTVYEPDGTDTFTITLGSIPSADVTINLFSTNLGECSVSPSSVTLTPANWDSGVEVLVKAEKDDIIDGTQITSILTSQAASQDARYNRMNIANVYVQTSESIA
ncbi:DUF1566 domain-containing protein [Desulfobacterales bacterium HSG17]|nr:DUF1566 domain-containing protein [Desulfobacterales bacterium HSG17]